MPEPETPEPIGVICGSTTLVGGALVERLRGEGWRVVSIDPSGAEPRPGAVIAIQGEIWREAFWNDVRERLVAQGMTPQAFIHALSGFHDIGGHPVTTDEAALQLTLLGAEQGCRALLPLLTPGRGAVVVLASVLAGWDTRSDPGLFSTTQAGLLALIRSQALLGAPAGVRVNAVGMGLVAAPNSASRIPAEITGRIPLGQAASPDDIADAVSFLISPDASHITGSTLVVDGGQSLQSWSNAPREGGYPAPPRRLPHDHPPDLRFQGRVALVTGAAGGLGSAIARRLAAEGARLALLDRDGPGVERLASEIAPGGEAIALAADVTDEDALASAFKRAEDHFGRLDVIVNNAGIGGLDLPLAETPAARWDELLHINLRGVFLGGKHGVPALRRAGGGAIVNMGSSTGRHDTITGGAAYMASKAAVEAMTKSLALQVARDGIRANTLCPGIIETALSFRQQARGEQDRFFAEFASRIPLGRVGRPEDVAAAVAFLASDQARHITGASLLIDGGQTLRRWVSAPDVAWEAV